jgi:ketosteroid isomerase-like protein
VARRELTTRVLPRVATALGFASVVLCSASIVQAQAEDPRAALLAADRAASDTAARLGLSAALERFAAEPVVYLHPGAPVVQGHEAVLRLLASIPLSSVSLQWAPLHAELSGDGTFGVTFGVTVSRDRSAGPASEAPLRFGNYLSAWRWESGRWYLLALAHVGGTLTAATGGAPDQSASGVITPAAEPFAEADRRFAAMAGRDGAPRAFEMFAAGDAVTFPGGGTLTRGPAAIRASLERGREASWAWRPIVGDAAGDGTLGFTVGVAEIRRTQPDGTPATTRSKYLSLWRREPDGTVRFLADGGSARP